MAARRQIALFVWLPALQSSPAAAGGGSFWGAGGSGSGVSGRCPCNVGPAGLMRLLAPRLREALRVLEREGIVADAALTPWCRCGSGSGRRSSGSGGAGAGSSSSAAAVDGCFARLALMLDSASLSRLGNVASVHNELATLVEFWNPAAVGDAPSSGGGLQQWLLQFVGYLRAARGLQLLRPQQRTILAGYAALPPPQQALLATLVHRRICGEASYYTRRPRGDDPAFVWACPVGGGGDGDGGSAAADPLTIDASEYAASAVLAPLLEAGWLVGARSADVFDAFGGGFGGQANSPSGSSPALYASWAGGRTLLLAGIRRLALSEGFWVTALDMAGLVLGTSADPYPLERRFRLGALWACGLASLPAPWAPAPAASAAAHQLHGTHTAACPYAAHVTPSWFGISAVTTSADAAPPSSSAAARSSGASAQFRLRTSPTGLVPFTLFPHRLAYAQCRDARCWAKHVETAAADVGGSGLSMFMLGAAGSGGSGADGGGGPTHTLRRLVSQVLYRPLAGSGSALASSSSSSTAAAVAPFDASGWSSPLTYSGPSIYRWRRAAAGAPPLRVLGLFVDATAANCEAMAGETSLSSTGGLPSPAARALAAALAPDVASGDDARWWAFPEAGPPPLPPAGALAATTSAGGSSAARQRTAAALAAAADGRVFTAPFGSPPARYIPPPVAPAATAAAARGSSFAEVSPLTDDAPPAASPHPHPPPPVSVSRPVYASSWAQREANPVAHYARGILSAADAYNALAKELVKAVGRGGSSKVPPRVDVTQAALEGVVLQPDAAAAAAGVSSSPTAAYTPQPGEGDVDSNPGAAQLEAARLAYFLLQLHTGAVAEGAASRAGYITSPAAAESAVVVLDDNDNDDVGDGAATTAGSSFAAAATAEPAVAASSSSSAAAAITTGGSRHARRVPDAVVLCDGAGIFHREHTYFLLKEVCEANRAHLLGARIIHRALHADPLIEWSSYRGTRESNKWSKFYKDFMDAARQEAKAAAALRPAGARLPPAPRLMAPPPPPPPPLPSRGDSDAGSAAGKKRRRADVSAPGAPVAFVADDAAGAGGDGSDDGDDLFYLKVGDGGSDDGYSSTPEPASKSRGRGREGRGGTASRGGRGGNKGAAAAADEAAASSAAAAAADSGDGDGGILSPTLPPATVTGAFRQITMRLLPWPRTQLPPDVAAAVATVDAIYKEKKRAARGGGGYDFGDIGGGAGAGSSSFAAAAASTVPTDATAVAVSADFSVVGNRDEIEQFYTLERPLDDPFGGALAALGGGGGGGAIDADDALMHQHLRALDEGRGWAELCPPAAAPAADVVAVADDSDSDSDVDIVDGAGAGSSSAAPESSSSSAPVLPLPRLVFGLPRPILRPGKTRRYFVGADGEPWWVEHSVLQALTQAHDPVAALAAGVDVPFTGDVETGECKAPQPRGGKVGGASQLRFPLQWAEAAIAARVRAAAGFRLVGDPDRLRRLLYLRPGALAGDSGPPPLLGAPPSTLAGWETAVLRRGHAALAGAYVVRGLCPPVPVTHVVDRAVVGWTTPPLALVPVAGGSDGGSGSKATAPWTLPQRLAWAHGANGWRGTHGENVLWEALFAVLFWDVLYATPASLAAQLPGCGGGGADGGGSSSAASAAPSPPPPPPPPRLPLPPSDVPAAQDHVRWCLKTPWDSEPRDYNDADWTAPGGARRALVDERLAALAAMSPCALAAEVARVYASHAGCAAMDYRLRWESFPLGDLAELAHAAGPVPLVTVCGHLATHLYAFLGGLPDVVLWRPQPCPHCPYGVAAEAEAAARGGVGDGVGGGASSSSAVSSAAASAADDDCPVLIHFDTAPSLPSPPPESGDDDSAAAAGVGAGTGGGGGGRYNFQLPPELARNAKGGKKAAVSAPQIINHPTGPSYGGWSYWRYDGGAASVAPPGLPPAAATRSRWHFTAAALEQLLAETAAKRAVSVPTSSVGRSGGGGGGARRDDGVALWCAGAHSSVLLAEVKSPNDKLHMSQTMWLSRLSRAGLPAGVVKVAVPAADADAAPVALAPTAT